MNYKIAIRSHKRYDTIGKYTIKIIKESEIPPKNVFIFVGPNEIEKYKQNFPEYNILDGGDKGITFCNIKIREYFDDGDYIIQMDDDIKHLFKLVDKKTMIDYKLIDLINNGYEEINTSGYKLWGTYPVANPYFMRDNTTYDMRFIIGRVFGFINDGIMTIDNCREDYERTILYYEKYGGNIRFNNISADAITFKGKGGLAEIRTTEMMNKSVEYMMKTYPSWVRERKYKKKRPWKEIRLLKKKYNKI